MKDIQSQHGLTLVELMVAMTIGLILMLGATGVLITNQRAFTATEGLSQIQENSRIAVDMIARDIREAGGHPCMAMTLNDHTGGDATAVAIANILRNSSGVVVNPATNPGNRNTGQGALQLLTSTNTLSITTHTTGENVFTVNNNLRANDIIIVCTGKSAHILRVSAATPANVTVTQAPGVNLQGATIAAGLNIRTWYVGTDNFLYRSEGNGAGVRMIDNVVGLNVTDVLPNNNGAIQVGFTLCSRNQNTEIAAANNLCAATQIERRVTTVVQRRTA
ncbi:PilW family protein [Azonexus hydrophilus]|jgi:type IV pilus assembly protein PilW|uniref:Prepilin-type N-terminal cleavage/methylation domain-containing protein n=1 Tax=Azonexus hydrophilus TaxID=418702 RepID=A0ABZ2XGQ6_9RHOO|nr:prepilin-type N-terminal cleavage/methylation domain-containing protein [Azonexus hydrophilus]MBS4020338.1 prepilin-type N-terminal cleavage/methylation domain-containing protein [Dechloromonas sp.]